MDLDLKFVSSESLREKATEKLGFNLKSGLDVVNRTDYGDLSAFLDAAAAAELKHGSPEFREARRRVEAEYRQRQEADARKVQNEAFKDIRGSVSLDSVDRKNIDAEAADLARRDLAAGRITASMLGKRIEDYAAKLGEERKSEKAGNALFNAMLRGKL